MRDVARRFLGALIGALVLPVVAMAADPAAQLARMARALRETDYQGSLVYQHEGRVDSLRLFHAAGTPERERLASLTGEMREVARRGDQLVCRQGGEGAPLLRLDARGSLLPLAPRLSEGDPGPGYRVLARGQDRVAGYAADVIDLQASDDYRYGYRLWLERESALLLRAALLGPREMPLEQMMFVSLQIGARPADADLQMAGGDAAATRPAEAEAALEAPADWRFSALPAGFRVGSRLAGTDAAGSEHYLLTDGLANVSVYIEPRAASGIASVVVGTRGALSVYTRDLPAHRVLVLGTVPARTVEAIALALRRAEP